MKTKHIYYIYSILFLSKDFMKTLIFLKNLTIFPQCLLPEK